MTFSNADKAKHGKSAQYSLAGILQRCLENGYITKYEADYRIGKDNYNNDKQFYAPFMIFFDDLSKWALFTSTSMRTDRIKGQQLDAANLRNIDPSITHVYLIYPDSVSDNIKNGFIRQNNKYSNKDEYSAIDGVISQDMIYNYIESYAIRHKNQGQIKDIQGNNFESRVAAILSHKLNLNKWKNNDNTIEGMHYNLFRKIVECFELDPSEIKSIEATSDKNRIGRLPSGGNPKTDVLVTVYYNDDNTKNYTISCKRSSDNSVSIHQYNADSFADVLDKENTRLRELLNLFQERGNLRDFGEDNISRLTQELIPYTEKLALWALGGIGGDGNPEIQNAKYILIYDNNDNSSSIRSVEDYYKHLINEGITGHFGTLFSWTYPSKRKGQDIQLKCKIIK